jgi:glucose-6-phosphate 1-dehydrogenase
VPPVALADTVVGQYTAGTSPSLPGYRDDPGVPSNSCTETYTRCRLHIDNPRWHGVPFDLEAGKALDTQRTEIQIYFRDVPYSIYRDLPGIAANRLVIRVQPGEAIELHVVNKLPGLDHELAEATLNLHYESTFRQVVPDAYERLLLDVLKGERSLFIRDDELAAAWDVVTPLLDALNAQQVEPQPYRFGSAGPA